MGCCTRELVRVRWCIMRAQNSDVTASFRLRLLRFHVRARWRWVIFLSHFVASYFSVCTDHELRLWGKIRSFVLPYPLLGFTALYQPYLRPRNEIHIFHVYTRAHTHTTTKIRRNASKRMARRKRSKTRRVYFKYICIYHAAIS